MDGTVSFSILGPVEIVVAGQAPPLGPAKLRYLVATPSLVAHHPLQERLREHHMAALYGPGRRADVVSSYQDLRVFPVHADGCTPVQAMESNACRTDAVSRGVAP